MTWLIAASLAFAVGGACMKAADGFTHLLPSVGVAITFLAGAVLLTRAVQVLGLSSAYIAGLGIEALASIALGRYLFGERLSLVQGVGLALIIAGVAGVRVG